MPTVRRLVKAATLLLSCAATGLALAAPADAAASTTAGTIRAPGWLNVRAAATTGSALAGRVRNGSKVTIACAVTGDTVAGPVRRTGQWDRLTSGRYISHAYVVTKKPVPACPPPPPAPVVTPPPVTTGPVPGMSNAAFITASVLPAQQGYQQFGVPASVTIAQAIIESGWGRSGLAAVDRNFFGIKCFNGSPGPIANGCHVYATTECLPVCAPTTASFRTYATAAASFLDHGQFLVTNSRYQPAFAYTHDPSNFLYQIWKAGYATSPTYVQTVQAVMTQYNLARYDLP